MACMLNRQLTQLGTRGRRRGSVGRRTGVIALTGSSVTRVVGGMVVAVIVSGIVGGRETAAKGIDAIEDLFILGAGSGRHCALGCRFWGRI